MIKKHLSAAGVLGVEAIRLDRKTVIDKQTINKNKQKKILPNLILMSVISDGGGRRYFQR